MQLQRLIDLHKSLADANRMRIVLLLAVGPLSGQELAEKLGLAPATVTHHMKPLRQVGIVREARNRNT
ncbi:MAG TPA: helix-turn-helix domain-containing protein, partial [Bacilli bacterium]|nr:helix-turn-helix domain-containing protein [Bacilli bacterium]